MWSCSLHSECRGVAMITFFVVVLFWFGVKTFVKMSMKRKVFKLLFGLLFSLMFKIAVLTWEFLFVGGNGLDVRCCCLLFLLQNGRLVRFAAVAIAVTVVLGSGQWRAVGKVDTIVRIVASSVSKQMYVVLLSYLLPAISVPYTNYVCLSWFRKL